MLNWTTTDATHTTTAAGLEFTLEPTDWSIWSLDQAKATARHIANLKACGLNPWTSGATVRLFYWAPGKEQNEHLAGRPSTSKSKRAE